MLSSTSTSSTGASLRPPSKDSPAGAGVFDQRAESRVVVVVDDGRVVRVVREGGVELRGDGAALGHEGVALAALHQRVVGRDAGLARVEELAPDEPRDEARQRRAGGEHRG